MKKKHERGKHTTIPIMLSDDPIFTRGPVVAGRDLAEEHGCTSIGRLPHDHQIYSVGALIFGRPLPPKKEEGKDEKKDE